jgi:citrate synthase
MLPAGKTALFARRLASAGKSVLGEAPTVDFALVAMARALGLPSGAALTLFAIGRTLGWIGHAIEQYEKDAIIRPRAKYVGVLPANGSP